MDPIVVAGRRFYALPVDAIAVEVSGEALTGGEDLVAAHLGRTRSEEVTRITEEHCEVSTIDRTLSGLYLLEQRGEVAYLADLRDGGQVYRQEGSEGELTLAFDGVDAFRRFRLARDGERDVDAGDEEALARRFRPRPLRSRGVRVVSTPALARRYDWLARFFGRERAPRAGDYPWSNGLEVAMALCRHFPSEAAEARAFASERPHLHDDPHLALYWLLHGRVLAAEERCAEVLAAIAGREEPLVRAFVDAFGRLAPDGDVPAAPDFRARRSLLPFLLGKQREPRRLECHVVGLLADPKTEGFHKAAATLALARALDAVPSLAAISRSHRGPELGLQSLAALLERQAGAARSDAADAALRALPDGDDPIHIVACLAQLHELASDRGRVHELVDRVIERDPHSFVAMTVGRDAALRDGDSLRAARFARQIAAIDEVRGVWKALQSWDPEEARDGEAEFTRLPAAARRFLATWLIETRRVSRRGLALAIATILDAGEVRALDRLRAAALAEPDFALTFEELRPAGITELSDPLRALVQELLLAPEHEEVDDSTDAIPTYLKRRLLDLLAPIIPEPELFDALLAALVADDRPEMREAVLSSFHGASEHFTRLSREQVGRYIRALAKLPESTRRPYQLSSAWIYLEHPGAPPALLELLDLSDDLQLRERLYVSLVYLPRDKVVEILGGRLLVEERSASSLARCIANVIDDELHVAFMSMLREARSMLAVGTYAASFLPIHRNGRRRPHARVQAIADEILDWPEPDEPRDRGRRRYLLMVATKLAIESGNHDFARRAYRAAARLGDPPFLDACVGAGDPIADDPVLVRWLALILAGERPRASTAARRRRPISDELFSRLAGAPIAQRLLSTPAGEVWCLDRRDRVLAFDGTSVDEAAFRVERDIRTTGGFLEGVKRCSGRATLWSPAGTEFRDIACYDDRLLIHEGTPGAEVFGYGLVGPSQADAEALFARIVAGPPEGWSSSEPWYVAGEGAIVRTYWNATGCRFNEPVNELRAAPAAQAAVEEQVLGFLRHRRGRLLGLEVNPRHRRPVDCEFIEAFAARAKDETRDAVWHLEALSMFVRVLRECGWSRCLPEMLISRGAPSDGAALARFSAATGAPVPEALLAAWRDHGPIEWRLGSEGAALLSPDEALARRSVLAALVEAEAADRSGDGGASLRQQYADAVIVIEDRARRCVVIYTPSVRLLGGRFVAHDLSLRLSSWEQEPLEVALADRLVMPFVEMLAEVCPDLRGAPFGTRPETPVLRRRWLREDELVELVLDPAAHWVLVRRGLVGAEGSHRLRRFSAAPHARAYYRARAKALQRAGFVEAPRSRRLGHWDRFGR